MSEPKSHRRRGRPPKHHCPPELAPPAHRRFAERLKLLQELLGESQTAFARRCGVSPTNMKKYLTAELQPGFDVLLRIADCLPGGVSLDWLLQGDGGTAPIRRGDTWTKRDFEGELAARLQVDIAEELRETRSTEVWIQPHDLVVESEVVYRALVVREADAIGTAIQSERDRRALERADRGRIIRDFGCTDHLAQEGATPEQVTTRLLWALGDRSRRGSSRVVGQPTVRPSVAIREDALQDHLYSPLERMLSTVFADPESSVAMHGRALAGPESDPSSNPE